MPSQDHSAGPVPVPNAIPSFWRCQTGAIDSWRSTDILPPQADIVIIGAGYAGASIVHHLIEEYASINCTLPSILILEAREACSAATGRNGGHLKPDPLSRAAGVLSTYGKEVAEHVASFEARQVAEIKNIVERDNVECDFEETRVTDVCLYEGGRSKVKSDIARLRAAGISTASSERLVYSPESKAEEISGVRGAMSCHTYSAARLWPYKLVAHVFQKVVDIGVNLQTHTPVTGITYVESPEPRSIVHTSRGSVKAKNVVYATNGYTSALLPDMKDMIVPVRGIVAHISGPNVPKMTDSYMLRFSDYEYDYLIPRPDGSIIVGGGKRDFYKNLDQWFDNHDDSNLIEGASTYFDGYMQRNFLGWEKSGAQTKDLWTGIMGYSNDGFPYVGPLKNRLGQYLCAGFSGHGMPQIFLAAKAIASMIVRGDDTEVDLPLPYRTTAVRMQEPQEHVSLKLWQQFASSQPERAML